MKNVAFTPIAFEEYNEWFNTKPEFIKRIKDLIRDIDREPFKGIGKPEPLKYKKRKPKWTSACLEP